MAGPFIAAGIAAVGAAFGFRAIKLGKVVRDPPRDDYSTPTPLSDPPIDMTTVGDSPVESAAAALVESVDTCNRALEAMMLALERASGAELAGDAEMLEARVAEVFEFARLTKDSLWASSELAGPFRTALDELRVDILAPLDEAGVPRGYLRPTGESISDDPVADLDMAMGLMAESDYEFAQFLEDAVADQSLIRPLSEDLPA